MGRIYYNSNGVILENGKILFEAAPVTTTTTTGPTLLTYPGSTHTQEDVVALGGSVWTIPTGEYSGKTIGVFYQDSNHRSLDMPSGWSIATGTNGRYYEVRFPCTFVDYCSHEFASYSTPTGFGLWPNSQVGYGGGTYQGQYVNCAQANENAPGYWITYYSNSPYFVRALEVVTWVLGTNNTLGHAGHEIISFGAF